MNRKKAYRFILLISLLCLACTFSFKEEGVAASGLFGWDGSDYDYLLLGSYPQTGAEPTPILWRALCVNTDENGSEHVLDVLPFDASRARWKGSDVRDWLNDTFLPAAFSESLQERLLVADEDVGRVFLLSQNELREPAYGFASDSKTEDSRRMATATDYAIRRHRGSVCA